MTKHKSIEADHKIAALRRDIAEGRATPALTKAARRAAFRRHKVELDARFEAELEARVQEIATAHHIVRDDLERLIPLLRADPQCLAIVEKWFVYQSFHEAFVWSGAVPIVGQPGEPITFVFPEALAH